MSNKLSFDHLAFSFPLPDLRHLSKGFTNGDFASGKINFPCKPRIESYSATELEDTYKHMAEVKKLMHTYYEQLLILFVQHVLGLYLGPMRGRGLHGYRDSMVLLSSDGIECGYVGIGGNANTVYFQISGTGCKLLFDHITPKRLHYWLSGVLELTSLSRVDLAFDDFDGNFTCDYAEMAYDDGAFQRKTGGPMPVAAPAPKYKNGKDGRIYEQEMFCVGSRKSTTYWRIYNKSLEQGKLDGETWYRSEVELKKWDIDVLIKPEETWSNLCDFAASIIEAFGEGTRSLKPKRLTKEQKACRDMASRIRWVRQFAGNTIRDICDTVEGDIESVLGLLVPEGSTGRLNLPDSYKHLVNTALGVSNHGH